MAGRSPSWIAVSFYRSVRVKAKSADTRPDPNGSRSNAAGRYWLARMSDTEQRLATGRLSIVAGGKRLARKRHNLEEAELSLEEWRYQWNAKRMFIAADGETGKAFGNETIRVTPHRGDDCMVTIRLPAPLSHLSNTPGRTPTYRLSTPIRWQHLAGEWNRQASADRAVGYAIRYNADRGRWYVTASWSQPPKESPTVEEAAKSGRCLAIDLNSGHIDARVLDVHGNPVGRPIREEHSRGWFLSAPPRRA